MATTVHKNTNAVTRDKKKGLFWGLKNTSFGESRSYIFEYGLLLLLTGGLISVVLGMIQTFYGTVSVSVPIIATQVTDVLLLSALTVLLPLVIILIQRTAETEAAHPSVKNHTWRKIFLGLFLAVVSVAAVYASILFINSILFYLSNGLLVSSDFNWESTLSYFTVAAFLVATAWVFGNDYRYVSNDHFANLRHYYRYGLVSIAVVVGLLFLFFPFRENRTAILDEQIVNDLYSINSQISSYQQTNGVLPGGLSDLSLTSDELQRSDLYNYSYALKSDTAYTICASFHGSASGLSASVPAAPTSSDFSAHTSGKNCFDIDTANSSETLGVSDTSDYETAPVLYDDSSETAGTGVEGSTDTTATEEAIY